MSVINDITEKIEDYCQAIDAYPSNHEHNQRLAILISGLGELLYQHEAIYLRHNLSMPANEPGGDDD